MGLTAIVGAGLSGILAAHLSRQQGDEVILIEADDGCGGLLRSINVNDYWFDQGTHFVSETGDDVIDRFLFEDKKVASMVCFNETIAGSYFNGRLSEVSPYLNLTTLQRENCATIAYEMLCRLGKTGSSKPSNAAEYYYQHYGQNFIQKIANPVFEKFYGTTPENLSDKVAQLFDLNRILLFTPESSQALKMQSSINNLIGFHGSTPGVKKYYPKKGGIESWIQELLSSLQRQKVKILTSSRIKSIIEEPRKIRGLILQNDQEIRVDKLVWSSPSPLLANLCNIKLNTPPPQSRHTLLYDMVYDRPLNSGCHYINCHAPELSSGRITLYQNLANGYRSGYGCTVEVLVAPDQTTPTIDNIHNELMLIGLVSEKHKHCYKGIRKLKSGFPILTPSSVSHTQIASEKLIMKYENLALTGRGQNNAFFMNEVLINTKNELSTFR